MRIFISEAELGSHAAAPSPAMVKLVIDRPEARTDIP